MDYWRTKHEKALMNMQDAWELKLAQCRKMFMTENDVLSHIVDRQMIDVVQNRFRIDRLRALLRVPKTKIKMVGNYGVFDFIKQCRDAIGENEQDIPDRPPSPQPFPFNSCSVKKLNKNESK